MNTNNTIPRSQVPVVNLALLALAGAQAHGGTVGLEHNTATLIGADLHDYAGNPATPEVPGKQALLNAQLLAIKTLQAAAQTALKTGRDFCHTALGVLRPILGHRWNGNWQAEGFVAGSLAVPRVPLPLLVQLRTYFQAHPAHENGAVTAVSAQAQVTAIQNAIQARETARGLRWSVKATRDASFKQLRKRLIGLRAELAQLLSPADDRWYAFGFRRPADGHLPGPVTGLVLTPLGVGAVLATWEAATNADDYRVRWMIDGTSGDPTEAGLFSDLSATLTGLPSSTTVVVTVTARNESGETQPAAASIVVP